jgi:hypothetical protein
MSSPLPPPIPPPPGPPLPGQQPAIVGAPPPPGWATQIAPSRPKAPTAAGLMIAGAVVMIVGSFLTWFTIGGLDVNGFTDFGGEDRDGPAFFGFAVILAAFGITTLAARRLLPIAILAVVLASFAAIFAFADYGDVSDLEDLGFVEKAGPGLPVVIVGSLIALAGGIVALAKRRR